MGWLGNGKSPWELSRFNTLQQYAKDHQLQVFHERVWIDNIKAYNEKQLEALFYTVIKSGTNASRKAVEYLAERLKTKSTPKTRSKTQKTGIASKLAQQLNAQRKKFQGANWWSHWHGFDS